MTWIAWALAVGGLLTVVAAVFLLFSWPGVLLVVGGISALVGLFMVDVDSRRGQVRR